MIYHAKNDRFAEDYGSFRDLAETVQETVAALRPNVRFFDSIIVTGVSGMAVGFPVALALKVPVTVLRKEDEDSHGSKGEIVGRSDLGERVLFLDDFVSNGTTRARVIRAVETRRQYRVDWSEYDEVPTGAKVVATFEYRDMRYTPR
jgi:orotate phosphoribosyltransferase